MAHMHQTPSPTLRNCRQTSHRLCLKDVSGCQRESLDFVTLCIKLNRRQEQKPDLSPESAGHTLWRSLLGPRSLSPSSRLRPPATPSSHPVTACAPRGVTGRRGGSRIGPHSLICPQRHGRGPRPDIVGSTPGTLSGSAPGGRGRPGRAKCPTGTGPGGDRARARKLGSWGTMVSCVGEQGGHTRRVLHRVCGKP